MHHDLPAGGKRLVQAADGYVATLVAGEVTYENGETRGPLPGRLVRGPQAGTGRNAPEWSNTMNASDVTPLEPACEWRRDDLGDSYVFQLTDAHLEELDARARARRGELATTCSTSPATSFPLPTLGAELDAASPASSSTAAASCSSAACPSTGTARSARRRSTGASGCTSGSPWPQNAKGHLLGDVTDQGKAANDPTSRGNEIGGIAFPFHSDGSDLVGLFCLDAGASGGASLVANVVTIHNELVRTEPELAAELYAPFPYDLRGEKAPGAKPWYTMPIFSRLRRPARSCATSARTSRRPAATTTRPGRRTRRARRWTGSTRCAPIRSTTCR